MIYHCLINVELIDWDQIEHPKLNKLCGGGRGEGSGKHPGSFPICTCCQGELALGHISHFQKKGSALRRRRGTKVLYLVV